MIRVAVGQVVRVVGAGGHRDHRDHHGLRGRHRNRFNKYVWDPARKAAGLPDDATTHDLRHFYASALIFKGRSAKTVAARLGHADPATTWKFYAGLWPDEEELSAQDLDDTFAEARAARVAAVPTACPSTGA